MWTWLKSRWAWPSLIRIFTYPHGFWSLLATAVQITESLLYVFLSFHPALKKVLGVQPCTKDSLLIIIIYPHDMSVQGKACSSWNHEYTAFSIPEGLRMEWMDWLGVSN